MERNNSVAHFIEKLSVKVKKGVIIKIEVDPIHGVVARLFLDGHVQF